MKRKNGFTLIELLAVIVILAIIALIITPIIMNVIHEAKKGAAKDSAYGYIEAIELENAKKMISNQGLSNDTYQTKDGDLYKDSDKVLDVNFKGTKPADEGTVTLTGGRVTNAKLNFSGFDLEYDGQVVTIVGETTGNTGGNKTEEPVVSGKMKIPNSVSNESDGFYGSSIQRKNVERIITTNTNIVPSNAKESIDVSEEGNGSVMIWFLDEDNNGKYELYIGQRGKVILTSGTDLFKSFSNVTSIDLTYLDTSKVTDMRGMFAFCYGLTSLDVSSFDTSKVTYMSGMFAHCSNLATITLGRFNIENVTSSQQLFYSSSKLSTIRTTNETTKTWLEAYVKENSISATVILSD